MKTAVFAKAGQMVIKDVDQPTIQQPDDVIIRVVRACVCGSDLWAYRGLEDKAANSENGGHEAIGIVTAVGDAITTVQPGDFVIAPTGVALVRPVLPGSMGCAKRTRITSVPGTKPSTSGSNTGNGPWSRCRANPVTTVRECSSPC